jgi:hypothetical protein
MLPISTTVAAEAAPAAKDSAKAKQVPAARGFTRVIATLLDAGADPGLNAGFRAALPQMTIGDTILFLGDTWFSLPPAGLLSIDPLKLAAWDTPRKGTSSGVYVGAAVVVNLGS